MQDKKLQEFAFWLGNPGQFLFFLRVFFFIAYASLLLKFCGGEELVRRVKPHLLRPPENLEKNEIKDYRLRLGRYANFLLSRNFLFLRSNCLKKSLVYYHFLNLAGLRTRLWVGAAKNKKCPGSPHRLHAWVEVCGEKPQEGTKNRRILCFE